MINIFASSSGNFVTTAIAPAISELSLISSIICTLFVIIGGYQYMSSKGDPERLIRAKKIIKNALIGLVIVLSAALVGNFLRSAYGPVPNNGITQSVPSLSSIKPDSSSSGLITVIIKAITGVLGDIIETVGVPFLKALSYFTSGTPLVASNHSVLDLWVSTVGISDALIVLVIVLLGLHTMGYLSLGLQSISIRHLLPQLGLVFILINSSIFIIDSFIGLSNVLIKAISGGNAVKTVWQVLETVVKQPSTYGLAALIIMTIFLVFSVILLIYYVGRIVTIYLGAVLAPLVILCWLLPSTKDMATAAAKRYFSAIFVLFIHVVILELSASLLNGLISNQSPNPDPLMAMVVGLATLIALLKTQGVMSQMSYATIGPRMTRQIAQRLVINTSYLGSQFSNGVSAFIPGRQDTYVSSNRYANNRPDFLESKPDYKVPNINPEPKKPTEIKKPDKKP